MAFNNTIKLTGNIGNEPRIVETETNTFAAFSIATTDSYKDENDNWQDKETIWHDVLVFNPKAIEMLKSFKKGTRLEIIGSLSYRSFDIELDGKTIKKKEASIVANKIDQAPLVKKTEAVA